MKLQLDPGVVVLLLLVAGMYVRAVRRLSKRGYSTPWHQQTFWWIGMSLLTFGLCGPSAAYADQLFWAHMSEHLLIADLAAPFLLAGIRTPVGLFMLPKDVLVPLARSTILRRLGGFVTRPLIALPIYVFVLYAWHLGPAFEAATRDSAVHALQHQSFLLANLLLWWPAIEPNRRPMPAPLWKVGYLLAARMASVLMGALFLVSNRAFYADLYAPGDRLHGISPVLDQRIGASIMMITDVVIMMTTLVIYFALAAADGARQDARDDALRREAAA